MYFNSKTAMKVTGVTKGQLQYWDKVGIVRPSMPASGRGSQRLYTFGELVQLKTATSLRDQGLSLQRLRKALVNLRKQFPDVEKPLAEMMFLTDGDTVFVVERDPVALLDVLKRQLVFSVPLGLMVEELRGEVRKLSSERRQTVRVRGSEYEVILTPELEEGGFSIRCPEFRANSQGETEQEAIDNIIDAIEACLDAQEEMVKEQSAEAAG
jgi:DNA-binding transcriptional MerR regulator